MSQGFHYCRRGYLLPGWGGGATYFWGLGSESGTIATTPAQVQEKDDDYKEEAVDIRKESEGFITA